MLLSLTLSLSVVLDIVDPSSTIVAAVVCFIDVAIAVLFIVVADFDPHRQLPLSDIVSKLLLFSTTKVRCTFCCITSDENDSLISFFFLSLLLALYGSQ
jgi:hypothetical protein